MAHVDTILEDLAIFRSRAIEQKTINLDGFFQNESI